MGRKGKAAQWISMAKKGSASDFLGLVDFTGIGTLPKKKKKKKGHHRATGWGTGSSEMAGSKLPKRCRIATVTEKNSNLAI